MTAIATSILDARRNGSTIELVFSESIDQLFFQLSVATK